MKKCKVCNQLYADNFEQCPNCVEKGAKIIKKIAISAIIIFVIIILQVIVSMVIKKETNIISIAKLGDKYPYTVDNMRIECASGYPKAIYIEDKSGNKYALNGNANVYFTQIKKDKKYKGYSSAILKDGMTDAEILQSGLNFCKD